MKASSNVVLMRPSPSAAVDNPYLALLGQALGAAGWRVEPLTTRAAMTSTASTAHIHWPEAVLAVPSSGRALVQGLKYLATLSALRLRGRAVVWTVHNLKSHEVRHPRLEAAFLACVVRLVSGTVSLSPAAQSQAFARYPRLRRKHGTVTRHGHYRTWLEGVGRRAGAPGPAPRADGVPVVAFLGQIRPYKGILALTGAHAELSHGLVRLLVAGACRDTHLAEELVRAASERADVELHLGHLPDEQLLRHLERADLVVLPFREVLNSGSALLALSRDRPILVPGSPGMDALRQEVGEEWVRTYDGPLDGDELKRAVVWAQATRSGGPDLSRQEWTLIASDTTAAYRAARPRSVGTRATVQQSDAMGGGRWMP